MAATLEPAAKTSARRQSDFDAILARLDGESAPIHKHLVGLMRSFRTGLFAGDDAFDQVHDNLDLERWFRLPKGHERRIHGHRHAGVRIVQEGPTLVHALDAHHTHPEPFGVDDLLPYRSARAPACQGCGKNFWQVVPDQRKLMIEGSHTWRIMPFHWGR